MSSTITSQDTVLPAPPDPTRPWQLVAYGHTHWDREWYQPFERFRMQLLDVIDRAMDVVESDAAYTRFTLDGQTIVVDDFLDIRPHERERLTDLIRAGRLEVGPWYVLPDEFLVSGESLIRNLDRGLRDARQLGGAPAIGYVPDPFGHVAQLPQILAGFGIQYALFSRGMDDRFDTAGNEFTWRSPDGTAVTAHVQTAHNTNGYCNAERIQWLDSDPTDAEVADSVDGLLPILATGARSNLMVIAAGVDHDTVYPELPERLAALERAVPGTSARIGGLSGILEQLEAEAAARDAAGRTLDVVDGELRGARHSPLLSGIFSARTSIKQDNVHSQIWLERYIEPLTTMAAAAGVMPPVADVLRHAWGLLLRNAPHDSIGGCSVDHVHLEMQARTRRIEDLVRGLLEDVQISTGTEAEPLVFNPNPEPVAGLARTMGGRSVRVAELPALGVARLADVVVAGAEGLETGRDRIANAHLRVEVVQEDGDAVVQLARRDGSEWVTVSPDAIGFVSTGDVGDEYDYSPVLGDSPARARLEAWSTEAGDGEVSLLLTHEIEVPASAEDRASLAAGEPAARRNLLLVTAVRLGADDRAASVVTTLPWHDAEDHRLRLRTELPGAAAVSAADSHFAVVERAARQPQPAARWAQQPSNTHASDSFVAADSPEGGVALFHRGLHEYELVPEAGHLSTDADAPGTALELTLLRCVGVLSAGDVVGRSSYPGASSGHAGPALPSPGAQNPGGQVFEYALAPYAGTWETANIPRLARTWHSPPLVIEPPHSAMHGEPGFRARRRELQRRTGWDGGTAALESPGLQIRGARMSALFPCADGSGAVVLRLYNPLPSPVAASITLPGGWHFERETLLDGETPVDTETIRFDGGAGTGTVPAFRVVTLRLRPPLPVA